MMCRRVEAAEDFVGALSAVFINSGTATRDSSIARIGYSCN
jgi:hypothetical protein